MVRKIDLKFAVLTVNGVRLSRHTSLEVARKRARKYLRNNAAYTHAFVVDAAGYVEKVECES